MYFISYLADVLPMTNFFALPLNFYFGLSEAPRDNLKFGGILNCFTLCLTDNLTVTNFFILPPNVYLS